MLQRKLAADQLPEYLRYCDTERAENEIARNHQTNLRTNITPSDLGITTATGRRIRSRILHIVKQNAVAILVGRAGHLVGVGLRNAGYIERA